MTAGLYGHSQSVIQDALISTIRDTGVNLGGTTRHEARHASLVCSRFGLDLVRFTNSGTEANLHAVAGARRFTGKRKIVVFGGGYHGGCFAFDAHVGTSPAENVVDRDDWIVARYNDADDARHKIEKSENVAAVLVEGMQGHGCITGTQEFLQQVQSSARKAGAVFILDEVMTSRFSGGGLQKLEELRPDLTTMGKYLGGGLSFGCFGGRKEIMSVYDPREVGALSHSGTFNNNTLSMVAGYTGLSQIYTPEVALEFNAMGDAFRTRLQALSEGTKLTITGRGTITGFHFLEDGKKEVRRVSDMKEVAGLMELFWMEMLEERFWIGRRGFTALILGTPWDELERFIDSVGAFLERYRELMQVRSED